MPHNKTLYQRPGFWAALIIPLGVAFLISLFIGWHSFYVEGIDACWSAACINDALYMLKLPIGVAALVFPCVALVASHHGSAQSRAQLEKTDEVLKLADTQIRNTLKQIEITVEKNNYDKLISHQEYIFRSIDIIEERVGVKVSNYNLIYKEVFSYNSVVFFFPWSDDMEIEIKGALYPNFAVYILQLERRITHFLRNEDLEEAENLIFEMFKVFDFKVVDDCFFYNGSDFREYVVMDGKLYSHALNALYMHMRRFYKQLFEICFTEGKLEFIRSEYKDHDYSPEYYSFKEKILIDYFRVGSDGSVSKVTLSHREKFRRSQDLFLRKYNRWLKKIEYLKTEK